MNTSNQSVYVTTQRGLALATYDGVRHIWELDDGSPPIPVRAGETPLAALRRAFPKAILTDASGRLL